MSEDVLFDALKALTKGNPRFDQVLWDANRHVLSFRRVGGYEHINLWLHRGAHLEHVVERNGGPGGLPEVLWCDGEWENAEIPRGSFCFTLPADRAEHHGTTHVTSAELPLND